nr:hypothetical protein [Gemmatales bacterium]
MSVLSPLQNFWEVLGRSKLIAETQLHTIQRKITHTNQNYKPDAVASYLVKQGLLTPFQVQLLLQGKYRGFYRGERYLVLDKLGSGGMGSVSLCNRTSLQKLVALK